MKNRTLKSFWPVVGLMLLLLACNTFSTGSPPPVDQASLDATVAAAMLATQQAGPNLQATIDAAVAATRQAEAVLPPTPTLRLPTPLPVDTLPAEPVAPGDFEQVEAVIRNEVTGTMAQDLALLQTLYAPDAVVIDRGGTPYNPSDDTTWRGWVNIQRRYEAFFSSGVSNISLVDLEIRLGGNQAQAIHQGAVLDGTLYPDQGVYSLEKRDGVWQIVQLVYGNVSPQADPASTPAAGQPSSTPTPAARNDGLYELRLGNQHRYEEPWGWPGDNPCAAWESGNFDDTRPNYRGFNVELLLTNNSDEKVPDEWPVTFTTANGQQVAACSYVYDGAGPPPDATTSVTFFTVVEQGDYVETITFNLNGQTVRLCLDGQGGWEAC